MKMKKFISLVVATALTISSMLCAFAADEGIKVYLEGNKINFDVLPQTINDRTMVPIRAIFEAMGANVTWDGITKTAISTKKDTTVKMTLNSTTEYINGTAYEMDVTPVIIEGRILAPARYVAEAFGYTVKWDADTQAVIISSDSAMSAFDRLKNTIISKGELENEEYKLVAFQDKSSIYAMYSYAMYYQTTEDRIELFFIDIGEESTCDVLITIDRYECPDILFTFEISDSEYQIFAEYSQFNKPYNEISNTFPYYIRDETEELLNASLQFMDFCTKDSANISLSDFGIYYEQQ